MVLPNQILIAGVGNELLSDDGIGVQAIRALQKEPVAGATAVEVGTAVLHALSFMESAGRVLVIDAALGGAAPGTVYVFEQPEASRAQAASSLHALSLRQAAQILYPDRPLPPITVIGVEPSSLEYGMGLSKPVRDALPRVLSLAREIIARWKSGRAERTPCPTLGESAA